MVTKHLLKELGYEVTFVNHVDSQPCEGMGIQTKFRTDETCNAEVNVRARRRGEEAKDTCLCEHEVEPSRPNDKMSYI